MKKLKKLHLKGSQTARGEIGGVAQVDSAQVDSAASASSPIDGGLPLLPPAPTDWLLTPRVDVKGSSRVAQKMMASVKKCGVPVLENREMGPNKKVRILEYNTA
jgi:hypothetical protein